MRSKSNPPYYYTGSSSVVMLVGGGVESQTYTSWRNTRLGLNYDIICT